MSHSQTWLFIKIVSVKEVFFRKPTFTGVVIHKSPFELLVLLDESGDERMHFQDVFLVTEILDFCSGIDLLILESELGIFSFRIFISTANELDSCRAISGIRIASA